MSDFLWAATPSFTVGSYGLAGGSPASKVGASFLENLGSQPQVTVKSLENNLALHLATSDGLEELKRERMRLSAQILFKEHFNTKLITQHLEEAYR